MQDANKFIVRFPEGMRDMIKKKAKEARRSMNAEIVFQLTRIYGATEKEKAGEPVTA